VYLKRALLDAYLEYITVLGEENSSTQMLGYFHKENVQITYMD
jgi:hypothetical protein